MSTGISTPPQAPLTRPSGLGAVGWLLPLVLVLPAVLLSVLAVHELDRLYRADAGVLRAEQLVPYPLALRYGELGHDDPVSSARLAAARARWQAQGEAVADQVATVAWRERGGSPDVVVVAALDHDPARVAAGLRERTRPGEQIRVWREGDRAVVALVTSSAGRGGWPTLDERVEDARTSIRLQRAASLTVGAVLPVVAVVLLLVVLLVATAVVVIPPVLVYRKLTGRTRSRRGRDPDGPAVTLPSGVEVMTLPPWRRAGRSGFLRAVPLAVVALPAATSSLWPESLVWAGLLALLAVLTMRWAQGSPAARWLRRVLYLTALLGLTHAVLGWPASPARDRRVLGVLAVTAVLVAVLARHRLRRQGDPAGGLLQVRSLVFLGAFVVIAATSVALFLASFGATDARDQLQVKALALPGLLLLPLGARRLRAARALVQRDRLRREGAPEVLYLRSFADDRLRVRSERRSREGLERWVPWPSERFEDVLLRGFERMGPVVAIGRPGTEQSELGAARDLVVGDDWLSAVEHEMDTARFITAVLGPGQGLHLELTTLAARKRLDRVCVVVPPVDADEAARRLASGSRALDGSWGAIDGGSVAEHGEVVALVGLGDRRLVMVAPRRARASTYNALAHTVAGLAADQ